MNKRNYWLVVLSVALALAALVALTACTPEELEIWAEAHSPSESAIATRNASFPVSAAPAVVEAVSSNGTINIRGVEGAEQVSVTATLHSRGDTLEEANDRVGRIIIHMTETLGRVTLRYDASEQAEDVRRYSGVDFQVIVPVRADADLTTSNGRIEAAGIVGSLTVYTSNGQIAVTGCQGEFHLDTSNGEIRMEDVEATVDAETSNGAIRFQGHLLPGTHRMRTSNGAIQVTIPRDMALLINADTSTGSIRSSLPLVGDTGGKSWSALLNPPITSTLTLKTSNGTISIDGLPQ